MKERMLITGGHPLEGEVRVSGGKNTAVAVIPATLLCDEPCTIENLPDIADVYALVDILRALGAEHLNLTSDDAAAFWERCGFSNSHELCSNELEILTK